MTEVCPDTNVITCSRSHLSGFPSAEVLCFLYNHHQMDGGYFETGAHPAPQPALSSQVWHTVLEPRLHHPLHVYWLALQQKSFTSI